MRRSDILSKIYIKIASSFEIVLFSASPKPTISPGAPKSAHLKISSRATRPVYSLILLLALCSNWRRNQLAEVESFLLLKSAPWNFSGRVWRRRFDRQQRFLRANHREIWRKLQCLNCGSSGANSRRAQFESWIEVDEHGVQVSQ